MAWHAARKNGSSIKAKRHGAHAPRSRRKILKKSMKTGQAGESVDERRENGRKAAASTYYINGVNICSSSVSLSLGLYLCFINNDGVTASKYNISISYRSNGVINGVAKNLFDQSNKKEKRHMLKSVVKIYDMVGRQQHGVYSM